MHRLMKDLLLMGTIGAGALWMTRQTLRHSRWFEYAGKASQPPGGAREHNRWRSLDLRRTSMHFELQTARQAHDPKSPRYLRARCRRFLLPHNPSEKYRTEKGSCFFSSVFALILMRPSDIHSKQPQLHYDHRISVRKPSPDYPTDVADNKAPKT
jgi:hypothetical protein